MNCFARAKSPPQCSFRGPVVSFRTTYCSSAFDHVVRPPSFFSRPFQPVMSTLRWTNKTRRPVEWRRFFEISQSHRGNDDAHRWPPRKLYQVTRKVAHCIFFFYSSIKYARTLPCTIVTFIIPHWRSYLLQLLRRRPFVSSLKADKLRRRKNDAGGFGRNPNSTIGNKASARDLLLGNTHGRHNATRDVNDQKDYDLKRQSLTLWCWSRPLHAQTSILVRKHSGNCSL